jgi:hypothetical protein
MPTIFIAQNGTTIRRDTPITVTGCHTAKAKHEVRRGHELGRRGGRRVLRGAQ